MAEKDAAPSPSTFAPIESPDVSNMPEAERAEKTQFRPLETSAPATSPVPVVRQPSED